MRSFRNLFVVVILAAIFGVGAFYLHWWPSIETAKTAKTVASAGGSPKKQDPTPAPVPDAAPASAAETGGKDVAAAGKADKGNERMHDIPVAAEHPAKGLKIPYFDNDGKIQMMFVIGVATRLDADHIDMADMQVETFDEQGQHEMYIDLPTSILDLNTSVISTHKRVTIRREDFILTGESMEFNTKTKQGSLGGSVRMLIYNLDNQTPKPSSENPTPPQSTVSAAPQPASESKAP